MLNVIVGVKLTTKMSSHPTQTISMLRMDLSTMVNIVTSRGDLNVRKIFRIGRETC